MSIPARRIFAPATPHAGRMESQRGFTLIELMVAMTLGLFILVGVSSMVMYSSASEKTNGATSEISTNGRYALEVLRRDLLHAGYRGLSWAPPTPVTTTAVPAVTGECGTGFAINVAQPIWGSNDVNPFNATCIPASNYRTGDVLVTRHAALSPTPSASLGTSTLYYRTAYERGEVFLGSTPPPLFRAVPYMDHALETAVYYVSPFSTSPSETPLVPALYRLDLAAGPAMTATLVASNVEDMQIQYGRQTTDLNARFYNANAVNPLTTPSEWNDVSTVRIWLLLRSTSIEPGYKNTATYVMGDKTITVNDAFRREVFSTVVNLRNK